MEKTKKRRKQRGTKKGTPYERKIAVTLSLWWTKNDLNGPNDNVFWRTSQSGGRSTTRAKAGKDGQTHCSDLCALDHVGAPLLKLMTLEIKKGYFKSTLHDLLDKPSRAKQQKYEEWIEKAERDRLRAGAFYWAIIHMRDRRRPIILTPMEIMNALISEGAMEEDTVHLCLSVRGENVCAVPLDEFLRGTCKEHIISVLDKCSRSDNCE